jgi:hypothetical protein
MFQRDLIEGVFFLENFLDLLNMCILYTYQPILNIMKHQIPSKK